MTKESKKARIRNISLLNRRNRRSLLRQAGCVPGTNLEVLPFLNQQIYSTLFGENLSAENLLRAINYSRAGYLVLFEANNPDDIRIIDHFICLRGKIMDREINLNIENLWESVEGDIFTFPAGERENVVGAIRELFAKCNRITVVREDGPPGTNVISVTTTTITAPP